MNQLLSLLVFTFFASITFSQQSFSKLSVDLNMGKTLEFSPITTNSRVENGGNHFGLGLVYMINPYFGIKGNGSYDRFKVNTILADDLVYTSHARQLRASLMAVIDLGELIGFASTGSILKTHEGFTLRTLIGGGVNSLNNQGFIDEFYSNYEHAYFPDGDRLVHMIFGLNPQYHLSNNLSFNIDFSYIYNFFYHRSLDWTLRSSDNRRGVMFTGSLGVSYRF